MKRVQGLDGVRGLAILWVLLYHMYALVPKAPWAASIPVLQPLANIGWIGVSLFFALSGYLIVPLLAAQRGDPHYFGRFWCRRAFRLLPVYVVFLGSFLAAAAWWPTTSTYWQRLFDPGVPFWTYGALVQNLWMSSAGYMGNEWLRVSWSLAVEVQFYALICLLVYFAPRERLLAWLAALVAGVVLFRYAVVLMNPAATAPLVLLLPSRLDAFLLGGLAAMRPGPMTGDSNTRRQTWALAMLVVCAVGFGWFASGGFGGSTRYVLPLYYLMLSVGSAALLDLAVRSSPMVRWLTENAAVIRAGQLSYFVYLFHLPVMWTVFAGIFGVAPNLESGRGLGIMTLVLAVLYGLAEASYRFLEAPLIKRGRSYFRNATES